MSQHPGLPVRRTFQTSSLSVVVTAIPPNFDAESNGLERLYELSVSVSDSRHLEGSLLFTQSQFAAFVSTLSGDVGLHICDWMASKPALAPLPPRPEAVASRATSIESSPASILSTPPTHQNFLSPSRPTGDKPSSFSVAPNPDDASIGPRLTLGDHIPGGGLASRVLMRKRISTESMPPARWWKYARQIPKESHREDAAVDWPYESGMLADRGPSGFLCF
jgi:hypothetical protein